MKQKIPKTKVKLFSALCGSVSECMDKINIEIGLFSLTNEIISASSSAYSTGSWEVIITTVLYKERE